jgi:flagellar biosynthesis/type III secretory pathway chaperone
VCSSDLLPLIDKEKEAAVAPDAQRLMALNGEKQALIAQLARLEQERTALAKRLGAVLHLPPDRQNLTGLAAAVSAPHGLQLSQLHDRLKNVVEKVRRSNEQCQSLIQFCLRLVQGRLGFFQHWMGGVDVYGASGNMSNGAGRGGRLLSGTI